MSSMRNAAPRRPHRERAQPAGRSRLGLLEKHKDYSLRAADYNQKKKKLSILSQKSREKHPDEFAFGMLSSDRATQGKHGRGDQKKNQLSFDAVKLLKTQDQNYLRTVAARGRKELDRIREGIGMDGVMRKGGVGAKKIVYDQESGKTPVPSGRKRKLAQREDSEEMDVDFAGGYSDEGIDHIEEEGQEQQQPMTTEVFEDSDDTANEIPKQKTKKQLKAQADTSMRLKAEKRRRKKLRELRIAKLAALQKRQKDIMAAADALELQRARMSRTVGGVNKNGIKFKVRERKK